MGRHPFISEHGQAYVALHLGLDSQHVFPIRSPALRGWIVDQYQRAYSHPPADATLCYAVQAFEPRALSSGLIHSLHRRVAAHLTEDQDKRPAISLDLFNGQGHAVEITSTGWTVRGRADDLFLRSQSVLPVPAPIPPTLPKPGPNSAPCSTSRPIATGSAR